MDNQKQLTEYEKRVLEGIAFAICSMDICQITSNCSGVSCKKCPMHPIVNAQENFLKELEKAYTET